MIKTKIIQKEVTETEDILCNKCGKTCIDKETKCFYGVGGSGSGGYFSTHFVDEQDYQFELCEKCSDELFKTFKIPPEVDFRSRF